MPALAPGTNRAAVAARLVVVWVLWGSVYLGIRLVIDDVAPFQAMAQRFLLAGVLLVVLVVARRGLPGLLVTRRQLWWPVITGTLLVGLGNGLQALAQVEGLPSGVTALVVAAVPARAVLLRFALGERPAAATIVGVALGFVGLVTLVVLGQDAGGAMPVLGVALCMGSSLTWTVGSYLQGVVNLAHDVFVIAAYQQLVACVCATILTAAGGEHVSFAYSPRGWFALFYLVIACCCVVAVLAFAWLRPTSRCR